MGRAADVLARYLVYLIIAIVFLLPFIWMFFGSVREDDRAGQGFVQLRHSQHGFTEQATVTPAIS